MLRNEVSGRQTLIRETEAEVDRLQTEETENRKKYEILKNEHTAASVRRSEILQTNEAFSARETELNAQIQEKNEKTFYTQRQGWQ